MSQDTFAFDFAIPIFNLKLMSFYKESDLSMRTALCIFYVDLIIVRCPRKDRHSEKYIYTVSYL